MAAIPLMYPLSTPDGEVDVLFMRRPTLTDYAEVGQNGGDDLARGVALVARLCNVGIADILALPSPDLKAVMAEFNRLTCGAHS